MSLRERAKASLESRQEAHADELDDWEPVDLRPALVGELTPLAPSVLRRSDGAGLFYEGQLNGIHGDSGIGKSWLVLLAAVECIQRGRHVVWVDFEDPSEAALLLRLRALGVADEAILDRLHYFRPETPADELVVELVAIHAADTKAALVVIDSVGEAFGLEGINEASDEEVGDWMRRVGRRLADTGAAVVLVDHITKANEQPLHPSGSKRKRAAITGASYYVQAKEAIAKDTGGVLQVTCAKDRHGTYRAGAPAAFIRFSVPALGRIEAVVEPPGSAEERAVSHLNALASLVVAAVRDAGEPLSQRQLLSKLKTNKARAIEAINYAVQVGSVRLEDGKGRTTLHVYVCDLPTDDLAPSSAGGVDWQQLMDVAAAADPIEVARRMAS